MIQSRIAGPCQTTITAAHENVPTKPTATPTNAAADAHNSGSRSSLAEWSLRVGSSVPAITSIGVSLRQPRGGATELTIHPSTWKVLFLGRLEIPPSPCLQVCSFCHGERRREARKKVTVVLAIGHALGAHEALGSP